MNAVPFVLHPSGTNRFHSMFNRATEKKVVKSTLNYYVLFFSLHCPEMTHLTERERTDKNESQEERKNMLVATCMVAYEIRCNQIQSTGHKSEKQGLCAIFVSILMSGSSYDGRKDG